MTTPAASSGISARGLVRHFGANAAVDGIDLDARPGEVTGLLGPNGSGKSTLLRMLVGLVRPDAGSARVAGVELAGDGLAVRRHCTYAPGEMALYGEMRAAEHLDWFLRGRERDARVRARELARSFDLPLGARVRTFSHGMKRQLMFAAALAPRVAVRILDEASEGLDPEKRATLLELLTDDARTGTAVLLSSHHLGEVDRACAELVFLGAGRVIRAEPAERVRERARRVLRLSFPAAEGRDLTASLLLLPGRVVRVAGASAVIELASDDPRPYLTALAVARDLPAPEVVQFGELSLTELYRDLYGVEAC